MHSVILTGVPSRDAFAPTPSNLSDLKRKLFGDEEREERSSGPTGPRYSEKVLIGNWYEERADRDPRTEAEWTTVNAACYKRHAVADRGDDNFAIWKNKKKAQGFETQLPSDGDVYLDNMTSSYDLSYRILPKKLCGPRIRVYNPRRRIWLPEGEMTLSYGNNTKYGLVETVREEHRLAQLIPPWQSIYKEDFTEKLIPQDFFNRRCLMWKSQRSR